MGFGNDGGLELGRVRGTDAIGFVRDKRVKSGCIVGNKG